MSYDAVDTQLYELLHSGQVVSEPQEVKAIGSRKRRYPDHVTALKARSKYCHSFIVADMETAQINDVHVPYADGFLVVTPSKDVGSLPDYEIESYFNKDRDIFLP